jgi:predicted nuclease of predicted toxin-antitoxin system
VKSLIDMNLSPDWGEVFEQAGWPSQHWAELGDARAPDGEIMEWARSNECIVFTHDLDFGALLASTGAVGPSVIQPRSEDTRPTTMGATVIAALQAHRAMLESGALVTIDPRRMRVTLLPLKAG